MEESSFEIEWSQILWSLVGFIKTNAKLFLLRHITTPTSIQARIIFLKIFLVTGGRTGLVVRASDSGSGDPGSILGRVGVLFP